MRSTPELAAQAGAFRDAHRGELPIILPNVWDVMSARAVEGAGFPFLATSSSAVAQSLGEADNNSMDPALVFGVIGRIATASALPVTADIEAGYHLPPAALAEALVAAGAIGCNLEDTDHEGGGLVDADDQAERIAALREAADGLGVPIVINARIDSVVRKIGTDAEQLTEVIRRGRLFLDAGADCVYPIMLSDEAAIGSVVEALGAPVNVNLRAGGPSVARLTELGVARVSYAGGLFRFLAQSLAAASAELLHSPESLWR